ncbi:MAG: sulfotransferase, partial [Pseudomonadota bacterium]|nr:sulfotransferase [Pseudomonadota bacterium]
MLKLDNLPPVFSPYMMAKTPILEETLRHFQTDPDFRWRLTYLRLVNRAFGPFRWLEEKLYNPRVRATRLAGPPLMILGHWRSGTTHLHYTLKQDPQFATVSNGHIGTATCYFTLGRWLTRLGPILPHISRPMDNLPVGVDLPQEEELALPAITTATVYYYWMLPRELPKLFDRYCLFEGAGKGQEQAFLDGYHFILQQATMADPHKPLLLKNPPNTARLALLAERYPDAKFVHIYRNPYDVYRSSQHLYDKMSAGFGLQAVTPEQRDEIVLYVYERMMSAYLSQRQAIPPERLVEVRFEDLERDGMGEIRQIYETLALPGWALAE